MAFLNVFDTHYLWAYLNYPAVKHVPPAPLLKKETEASTDSNLQGHFTSTGMSFYNMLVTPPDKGVPTVPSNVRGVSHHSKEISLKWGATGATLGWWATTCTATE